MRMHMHILILFCVSTYAESEKRNTHGFVTHMHNDIAIVSRNQNIQIYIYENNKNKKLATFFIPICQRFLFLAEQKIRNSMLFLFVSLCYALLLQQCVSQVSCSIFNISPSFQYIAATYTTRFYNSHFSFAIFFLFFYIFFNFFFPVMVCVCIVADAEGCYKSMALVVHSGSVK